MKNISALILVLLLAGCAADAQRRMLAMSYVEDPTKPVEIDNTKYPQNQLALVEITAPDFSAWIAAIDGKSVNEFNELSRDTMFLKPGQHSFRITFRNYQGMKYSEATTEIKAELHAGHTYMPSSTVLSKNLARPSGTVEFILEDYGPNFPRECLTGQITKRRNLQVATFEVRKAEYLKCIAEKAYK